MEKEVAVRRQIYPGYQGKENPTEKDRIVHFLQLYHSTEGFNAAFLTRWIDASPDEDVKGGLRVIQGRESLHARLLRERLLELGEKTFVEVPEERRAKEIPFYASTQLSDLDKLTRIMTIFAELDYFMRPMVELIESIQNDLQSKELLLGILDNEKASVAWFDATHRRLQSEATS